MAEPDRAGETIVRTYAVWCGLTPLIPLPLVDDMVRGYFRRRMVRALAGARGKTLAPADAGTFADEPGRGCLTGCLVSAIVYPFKRLFRKIFYFLEWKRAVDTGSETYHFGTLVDYVFQERLCAPEGPYDPARVRAAIDAVLRRTGTNPIESAVRQTFLGSKSAVRSAVRALRRALIGVRPRAPEAQVEQAIATAGAEDENAQIARDLGAALKNVPPGYLAGLCRELLAELREGREVKGK